jgi:hypothetical protein
MACAWEAEHHEIFSRLLMFMECPKQVPIGAADLQRCGSGLLADGKHIAARFGRRSASQAAPLRLPLPQSPLSL